MRFIKGVTSLFLASLVAGKVYFKETFDDDSWKTRWVQNENSAKYKIFVLIFYYFFFFFCELIKLILLLKYHLLIIY